MKNIITYEIKNKKYFKDGTQITKKQVKLELTVQKFNRLVKNNICNVRVKDNTFKPEVNEDRISPNKHTKLKLKRVNNADFARLKSTYKVDVTNHPKFGVRYELWHLNEYYGYYNFVKYLEDNLPSTIDNAILEDINKKN